MKSTKITIAGIVAFTTLTLPTSSFAELEKQKQDTIEIQAKDYNNIDSFKDNSSAQSSTEQSKTPNAINNPSNSMDKESENVNEEPDNKTDKNNKNDQGKSSDNQERIVTKKNNTTTPKENEKPIINETSKEILSDTNTEGAPQQLVESDDTPAVNVENKKNNIQLENTYSRNTTAPNFTDVPSWAKEAVDYLVGKNVINGYPDGRFAPYDTLTRAQAATIIAKSLELPIDPTAKPTFYDAQNNWATPYIAAVEKAGVIVGDGTGRYNPDREITRASMASILVKAYNLDKDNNTTNLPTPFPDLIGHWGEKYANTLVAYGVSNGVDDSSWLPNKSVTRAEGAQFVANVERTTGIKLKKEYIDREFYTYNAPSLSSGIASSYAPQTVAIYEEEGDWIKISTHLGLRWIPRNEIISSIDRNFVTFDQPSRNATALSTYTPQNVKVVAENGSWIQIKTYAGLQWVDKNVTYQYIPKVFFAYDEPNYSSRVSFKYAPQNVVVEQEMHNGWSRIQTGNGLKWVNINNISAQKVVLDVPIHRQFPELYNGCEAVALQMMLEYNNGISLNKVNFANEQPFDRTPMQRRNGKISIWGDPDVGFVGDVSGNKPGFAINPGPLKTLLDRYARGTNLTGQSFSILESYVRNGKPVVAWVTENLGSPESPTVWKTTNGKTIYGRMNTHAVTITGIDDNSVYYNDSITGQKNARADKDWFIYIYNQMGNKALSID
ncbi:S-layer protein [Bacillus sp. AFS054943]|uniref:S-layer protein n=1 Tax=Bacillus cereus TaxID=1396 RepID=A0A2C1LNC8_BACCE|nr:MULTISPECIES: S-layer homology domain-containing protein [Bacillus]PGL85653.1 S-layer protein [Bacillus sp. AFS054943]PGT99441.1 S-layer protein [Bacillus cereus]